ncbi:MAG: DnaJ family domain-containing protein [Sporolactobacillus sp.]
MGLIEQLAEEKISQAIKEGVFDGLPGRGRPQRFEDDSAVPAELRIGYKMLKNAGYLPEELKLRQTLTTLADLLHCCRDGDEKEALTAELKQKRLEFERMMQNRSFKQSGTFKTYRSRLLHRLRL